MRKPVIASAVALTAALSWTTGPCLAAAKSPQPPKATSAGAPPTTDRPAPPEPDKTPPASAKAPKPADTPPKSSSPQKPSKKKSHTVHRAPPPAQLIDPNLAATAIEIDEAKAFGSITVKSAAASGSSAPVIAVVSSNTSGQQRLHEAIRKKPKLVRALKAHDHLVDDVIAVSLDARNDIVLFTRH